MHGVSHCGEFGGEVGCGDGSETVAVAPSASASSSLFVVLYVWFPEGSCCIGVL